jgi:glycosyltransferase involved in cell wall biosynthesis
MPESVTTEPLRVCHVFAGVAGGRWVHDQVDRLRNHGCEVRVLLAGEEGPTVDLCRSAGIPVTGFDFSSRGLKAFLTLPWRVIRLAWWMREQRFDVVQSHTIASTLFARPAAWFADVPVRLEMSTSPFYMQAPSMRRLEVATAWMETGLIPSCALTEQLYRQAGVSERLIQPILYYGPDEARFDPERAKPEGLRAEYGLAADTPLIGSIAIFYPKCKDNSFVPPDTRNRYIKGHYDVILAMHHVRRLFPEARLMMIGCGWGLKGPEAEADLRAFVAREGLGEAVIFAGWRPSTAAVYMDLDVSVQASLNENLGGTIESLLMARPTVATRVGGMVDSVIDGRTGILVRPEDPEDLARGIIELLRDRDRAAALGKAGRELMLSRFTLSTTVPALAAIYRRQRASAPGAFRLHVGLLRLLLAVLLAPFLFARATFDYVATAFLPARLARLRRVVTGANPPRDAGRPG